MHFNFATAFSLLALTNTAFAHYRWTKLVANGVSTGEYQYVRLNTNYNSPVTDVTSNDIRCNTGTQPNAAKTSTRLALLDPFESWPSDPSGAPTELFGLKILLKVKGQCTTDTISAAGPWLKFKGHLPNIAENTLIGAVNAETGATNQALDVDGSAHTIPDLAKKWKAQNQPWLVVAEHNYGEGSAREHAALQPRWLGARLIVAKSFARIHETNLKKQGVVPLTFVNEADYDLLSGCDEVSTEGLAQALKVGSEGGDISSSAVSLVVKKKDGKEVRVPLKHALSRDQCGFVLAGSALNLLAKRNQS
jgi:homoaconitase